MIIKCNNCNKKFNVEAGAIPEKGRLLQCNNCNYKWFFKKEIINEPIPLPKTIKSTNDIELFKKDSEQVEIENSKSIELLDKKINEDSSINEILINPNQDTDINSSLKINPSKEKKNYNPLSLIVIFIISFVALIIIFDTFQAPLGKFFPNIEFLLYNLYETINDIKLFLIDLI